MLKMATDDGLPCYMDPKTAKVISNYAMYGLQKFLLLVDQRETNPEG
jgi:hypothetical protein